MVALTSSAMRRAAGGAVLAAAVLVPVVFTRQLADPFMVVKATVLWVAAAVALAALLVAGIAERRSPVPWVRTAPPALALIGWTAVASAASAAPVAAIWGSRGRYDGLLTLLACLTLAAAVIATTWRAPERLEALVVAIGVGGGIAALYVLLEQLGLDGIDWQIQGTRDWLVGLGGNPNFSGAHLALVLPLVVAARGRVRTTRARVALAGLAVLLLVGVWCTGTRAGLVAATGGVAATGLLMPALLPRLARIAAVTITAALLAMIALSTVVEDLPTRQPLGDAAVFASGGLQQRTNIWAGTVSMIGDHPIVGVGPDGFGRSFYEHRPSRGGLPLIAADEAHDIYLDRAATTGLPGLAAQVWLLAVAGLGAWRARGRIAPEHRWLLGGFGGVVAGYLLQGAFSIDTVPLLLLGWSSLAAVVSLSDPGLVDARRRAEAPQPGVPVPLGLLVAGGGALLVVTGFLLRPAIAERHARVAELERAAGDPLAALARHGSAASWLDAEPHHHASQGDDLVAAAASEGIDGGLRRTLLDEALVAYASALERSPGDVRYEVARAQVRVLVASAASGPEEAAASLDAAEATYRSLLDGQPAADDLHLPYGRLLEARHRLVGDRGALRAAVEQYRAAAAYNLHREDAVVAEVRALLALGREAEARERLAEELASRPTPLLRRAEDDLEERISAGG